MPTKKPETLLVLDSLRLCKMLRPIDPRATRCTNNFSAQRPRKSGANFRGCGQASPASWRSSGRNKAPTSRAKSKLTHQTKLSRHTDRARVNWPPTVLPMGAASLFAGAADDEVEDDGGIDGHSVAAPANRGNLGCRAWGGAQHGRVLRFAHRRCGTRLLLFMLQSRADECGE